MSIDVNNESDFEVNELEISSQAQFVLRSLHINPAAELSVLLVDEIAMATLHEKFMDEPGSTDVLSFPMDELRAGTPDRVSEEGVLGDVVLCPAVAARQGEQADRPLRDGQEVRNHRRRFHHRQRLPDPENEHQAKGREREVRGRNRKPRINSGLALTSPPHSSPRGALLCIGRLR